ncbi:MAG: hypothetical protein MHMPM18_000619 [Marteilia pararefringens]
MRDKLRSQTKLGGAQASTTVDSRRNTVMNHHNSFFNYNKSSNQNAKNVVYENTYRLAPSVAVKSSLYRAKVEEIIEEFRQNNPQLNCAANKSNTIQHSTTANEASLLSTRSSQLDELAGDLSRKVLSQIRPLICPRMKAVVTCQLVKGEAGLRSVSNCFWHAFEADGSAGEDIHEFFQNRKALGYDIGVNLFLFYFE